MRTGLRAATVQHIANFNGEWAGGERIPQPADIALNQPGLVHYTIDAGAGQETDEDQSSD